MRMTEKTVVVTGAGGDIGRALSFGVAREGGRVACLDIDYSRAHETASLVSRLGGEALPLACDLTVWSEVEAAADGILDAYERVDILLANAGGSRGEVVPFLELSPDLWDEMLDRNLRVAFYSGLAFANRMSRQGGGAIVFTSSELSEVVSPGFAHYCSAKGALKQLVRAMAVDLAPHSIRVNAIAPGPTNTRGTRELFERPEVQAASTRKIPMGRIAEPSELVGAALHLASDEASYTTGTTLVIDGGLTLV